MRKSDEKTADSNPHGRGLSVSVEDTLERELGAAVDFLCQFIRIPSLSGREQTAMEFLLEMFRPLADRVEAIPFPADFHKDPEYSFPIPDLRYDGRFNIRIELEGRGNGRSILFNTHADVVPPCRGQIRAFDPFLESSTVYGRGACDAKGQVATLYLLLRLFQSLGARPAGKLIIHLVVEEENGGNGTLCMVRTGETADAAVVLEPTGGTIVPSVRGAVWFRIGCSGDPGHSGNAAGDADALSGAIEVMRVLKQYHSELLAQSRRIPLFDEFENPMPLNFGKLHAGDWPASKPDRAVLEGVLGFLPTRNRQQIMIELKRRLRRNLPPESSDLLHLEFPYRHDCHMLPVEHELVSAFRRSSLEAGQSAKIGAFPASCDSWYYQNLLQIPTVVYGPGHLRHAHSSQERIHIPEIVDATRVLYNLVSVWSDSEFSSVRP